MNLSCLVLHRIKFKMIYLFWKTLLETTLTKLWKFPKSKNFNFHRLNKFREWEMWKMWEKQNNLNSWKSLRKQRRKKRNKIVMPTHRSIINPRMHKIESEGVYNYDFLIYCYCYCEIRENYKNVSKMLGIHNIIVRWKIKHSYSYL